MLVACLLALALSLQISCSTRSGLFRRCIPRTTSNASPHPAENDENPNLDFKMTCLELSREIKALAMSQLGLSGSASNINYSDYEILNWPQFVPFHFKNWDEQAVEDLRAALPSLLFKPFTSARRRGSTPSDASMEFRIMNRRKLLDKLVILFNQQTGLRVGRVPWCQYHLKNWPVGVGLRADRWNASEVLAVYRHIDRIRFVKIIGDEVRTITYTDGKYIAVDARHNPINPHDNRPRRRRLPNLRRRRSRNNYYSDQESEFVESESENDIVANSESSDSENENENVNSDSEAVQPETTHSSSSNHPTTHQCYNDDFDFGIDFDEEEAILDSAPSSAEKTIPESVTSPTEHVVVVTAVEDEDAELRQYDPNLDNFYETEFNDFLALFKQ